MAKRASVPEQLALLTLSNSPRGKVPRRLNSSTQTFLALAFIGLGMIAHMLLTPTAGSLTFSDYLRTVENPQWKTWTYDGLLILAKVLVFSGFIFGRRLAGMGLLLTAALAIFGHQLKAPSAWSWALVAVCLFLLVAKDKSTRIRQLRFLSPRGAQQAWLAKSQIPRDLDELMPFSAGVSLLWMWLGTAATVIGVLLLAGPYLKSLVISRFASSPQASEQWPLALVAFGLMMIVLGVGGIIWYIFFEVRRDWVLLDTGDTDPFEVFEAVQVPQPPLLMSETRRTHGCICAKEFAGEAAHELPEALWPDDECPRHGIAYLNALPAQHFLAIADQRWVYDEDFELQVQQNGSNKQHRILFNVTAMKGHSLRENSLTPGPTLEVSERVHKHAVSNEEPANPTLAEVLEEHESEEIIDILDLRSRGINGCVLRTIETMPFFFPEPVPAQYRSWT